MAAVRVIVSLTRSLGNGNFVKVGAEVEDEVPLSDDQPRSESIREHFKRLYELTSDEVDQAVSTAINELKQ